MMRLVPLLLSSVLVAGCSSSTSMDEADAGDSGGDGGGAGADAGDQPVGEGGQFLLYSNGAEPCAWVPAAQEFVCPPDHNRELFRLDFDLETGHRQEIRLTNNSDGIAPDWELYQYQPDDDLFMALSPDREWVYFANWLSGKWDILRVRADGSSPPEALTSGESEDFFLYLSADGQTVWFASDRDGDIDIYSMSADGSDVVNLSNTSADIESAPALLPDESGMIVTADGPDGNSAKEHIYKLRFDNKSLVKLTTDEHSAAFFGMTPDGSKLVIKVWDGVNGYLWNLYKVPTDGSASPLALTQFDDVNEPVLKAITPDSSRAIIEHKDGFWDIHSVNLSGDPVVTQISESPTDMSAFYRMMLSDGSAIIYTTNDLPYKSGDIELFSVPSEGGETTLLTDFANESYFLPFAHAGESDMILYESPLDGDTDLYAIPRQGGDPIDLTRNEWSDSDQGISDDGRYVFFSNLSDDPIYLPDGSLSPESDQDIYISRTDGQGDVYQLTDTRLFDRLHKAVMESGASELKPHGQGAGASDIGASGLPGRGASQPYSIRYGY